METLQKRYPFRLLPNMPPKKVGVDDTFLEKRRKGLARFINFVCRHPILRDDEVVVLFLTVKEELATHRRANPPDLNEEFARKKPPTDALQVRIPTNLDDKLAKTRKKLGLSIEHYKNLCLIMERLVKRNEGAANDYIRYSMTLSALAENEKACHEQECINCPQVARGFESLAGHLQTASSIMENQHNASNDGVLESLKRQRDLLVSLKELFERKDRLEGNQIDVLQKRKASNQTKLNGVRGVPNMEAEVDKLTKSIEADQHEIEYQRKRVVFIRYCMHVELGFFHSLTAYVSILYQNFVTDQIKSSEQLYQNWKLLAGPVYEMPNDPTTGFG
jgi:hypothetical protein